ncbi:MAG: PQQ-binding-like beta-propeller repeat protein, partial [Pirellulaceae bacterium]|nr:PQQ-binding-like beta-propeller repeat protein [Pirellulaceae bacterium]
QTSDKNARAPYLTQFLCEPWYVPMPQVTVSSGGRVFKAFGHIALKEREWPWLNSLVAINGYNGAQIWKRPLQPGFMIHRSTLIATPQKLYIADNQSCKILAAATGVQIGEIKIDKQLDEGGAWKWMALRDGVLYALIGPQEPLDTVIRGDRAQPGWPWSGLGKAYAGKYEWGFGSTLVAMDVETREMRWSARTETPVDSRALCLVKDKLFAYSHQKSITCLNATTGEEIWRTTDAATLKAIGEHGKAQTARMGFSSTAYMKANDKGLYFAGPQRNSLAAVSAENGSLMWDYPHGNFQLVLRADGLYAMGRMETSKKFDYLSGNILEDLQCFRGNCTRATGAVDSIFTRGYRHTGTMRLDLSGNVAKRIPLMRPACQDGVVISDGMSYWGPWMCDCNHSLVGMICLAPAGDFDFSTAATNDRIAGYPTADEQQIRVGDSDWPVYRGAPNRSATSSATIAPAVRTAWTYTPPAAEPIAPIAADGKVYWAGRNGVVRALDAADGKVNWTAHTGGQLLFPPEITAGRLVAGSGDGQVYCWDGAGKLMWRFQAAPAERRILVHGRLLSTWPVGGGVLARDGVIYTGAGLASYDGTHAYALDARTGRIIWQNNDSARLAGADRVSGVSVQGHWLFHDNLLYLAGGNIVSPAKFDPQSGKCLNSFENEWLNGPRDASFPASPSKGMFRRSPRGRELFVVDGQVRVFDELLYSPRRYGQSRYFGGRFFQAHDDRDVIRATADKVVALSSKKSPEGKPVGRWQFEGVKNPAALALCKNAVLVAGEASGDKAHNYRVWALNRETGEQLWSQPLPAEPVSWGMCVDASGRVFTTLRDGRMLAIAPK